MAEEIASIISTGNYSLTELVRKINTLWLEGELTDQQRADLIRQAEENANPEAERPEDGTLIAILAGRLDALEARVDKLEGGPEPEEDYPVWVQPVPGLTQDYQPGAIVSHNGKLWRSTFQGQNVWEPGTVGENLWAEYTPEN